MKIFDFETIAFRINLIAIACVLFLLAPSTRIIASWYPEEKDILWLFPVAVVGICSVLWFFLVWSMPALIRWNVFQDRRQKPRTDKVSQARRFWRITVPIGVLAVQMFLLIFMSACVIAFMRSQTIEGLLAELASGGQLVESISPGPLMGPGASHLMQ